MRRTLVVLGAVATLGCSMPREEYFGNLPDPDPTHFTLCNSSEPEFIDPALATSTTDMPLVYNLFDGLTSWDKNGLPELSMAEDYHASEDLETFTFKLRPGLTWSDGVAIDSRDFQYSMARVLHPITASRNSENLWKLRHAELYTAGTARLVLRDAAPFRAGEVVRVLPVGKNAKGEDVAPPDSNLRVTRAATPLRRDPDAGAEVWAKIPKGAEVTIIELGGPGCPVWPGPKVQTSCDWAYVFWLEEDGLFGWVPLSGLTAPHDDRDYQVVAVDDPAESARAGAVKGRDLLMLPELLGIEVPDPRTVVIKTGGPTPFLYELSAQRSFRPTPRHVVSRWPRRWTRPGTIVTSGEFDLAFWRRRDKFELVKSKTFWGRDQVRLERVTVLSMNDQAANANIYYQGGCDAVVANNIPNIYFPLLNGEKDGLKRKDYERTAFLGIYYYIINTKKLTNVHFRRALSHAIDRSVLPKILRGGQFPAYSFVPGTPFSQLSDADLALCGAKRDDPGVALIVKTGEICYKPPIGPLFDLEAAKRELELARKELGKDFPQKFTIKFNSGVEYHKVIAEWVQHEWKTKLGLDVETESQAWGSYLQATNMGEFDVGRFGNIGNFPDPEAEFLVNYKCKAADNRPRFCNEEFERLFNEAETKFDRKERLELIRRAEEIFVNEVALIPLYVYTQHRLVKPYVRGYESNLTDQHQFRLIWIDPDWNKGAAPVAEGPR